MEDGEAPRPVTDRPAILGESPVWSVADSAFYWVDIRGSRIHRWDPDGDRLADWEAPSFVGCIAPRRAGGLVVGLKDGLAFFEPRNGAFTRFAKLPNLTAEQRLNDGKCDAAGRLWVGSMNIVTREPDGRLYCVEADGTAHIALTGLAIPNCLSWSLSNDTLYFSQTRDGKVLAYPFELGSAALGEARLIHETVAPGVPDGATVDSEDRLWFAEHGSGRLTRLDVNVGVDSILGLPCRYPTSCAFGGADMKTLLITSASSPVLEYPLVDRPHEGLTYSCRLRTGGQPPALFAG